MALSFLLLLILCPYAQTLFSSKSHRSKYRLYFLITLHQRNTSVFLSACNVRIKNRSLLGIYCRWDTAKCSTYIAGLNTLSHPWNLKVKMPAWRYAQISGNAKIKPKSIWPQSSWSFFLILFFVFPSSFTLFWLFSPFSYLKPAWWSSV